MTGTTTLQTVLIIPKWYRDHHFNGQAILPSVEAMAQLAATAQENFPGIRVDQMEEAHFTRFLELPEHATELEVTIELNPEADNRLRARLLSRKQFKAMSRLICHCEVRFGSPPPTFAPEQAAAIHTCQTSRPRTIETSRIYQELVPFGPTYRSLQGQVYLAGNEARGTVRGPEVTLPNPGLGSPFCLDGAMHAACVHGQQFVDFVPFPVAFTSRTIVQPTQSGEEYAVEVLLQHASIDELNYDLRLWDQAGALCERVSGLRMRDVSSGRIRPPDWIKKQL